MKNFFIALVAGILTWAAIWLMAIAYQPTHAGSFVANVEIGLALIVAIIACFLLRLR